MLKSCVGYNNIISYYVNSKVGEIKITSNDWNFFFSFLKFLKAFYDTINMCSIVYTPTSCIILRCICNMSDVLQKYKDYALFLVKYVKKWKIKILNIERLF